MFQHKLWVAALIAALPGSLAAQRCPIQIEAVHRAKPDSSLLRIAYRNDGPFPVRGTEFRAPGVNSGKRPPKPQRILAFGVVTPGDDGVADWNAEKFRKKTKADPTILIWPALVELGDSSVWHGNAVLCGVTVDKGTLAITKTSPVQTAKTSVPNARNVKTLVSEGRASIVHIVSMPPGAEVDVGDWKLGTTPITFALLASPDGTPRSITISKPGYTLAGHDVTPNGEPFTFDDRLLPLPNH